jgi:hypothetical protein
MCSNHSITLTAGKLYAINSTSLNHASNSLESARVSIYTAAYKHLSANESNTHSKIRSGTIISSSWLSINCRS